MIDKIGTVFRPIVKKKQEEESKERPKQEKQEKRAKQENQNDSLTNSPLNLQENIHQLSVEEKKELENYFKFVNEHEFYKTKNLMFKLDDQSDQEPPKVLVENYLENKIIQKIGLDQFKKIHNTIKFKDEAPKSGGLINIKC